MTLFTAKRPNPDRMEVIDNDAWKNWFQLHGPKLLLCARQWTPSGTDAEDIVQEAFVRFWRNQRHLEGDPVALLVTSIRRAALDRNRRDSRRTRREETSGAADNDSMPWFVPTFEDDERREVVERALRQLPEEQRSVLVLKIWGELTFQQIAVALEIPGNTAASRYRYALAALRQQLTAADRHG